MQLFKKAGQAVAPRSLLNDFDSFVKEGARKREWAEHKGYNSFNDYSFYHPKLKMVRNPVVFLTREELFQLYSLKIQRRYPSSGMLAKKFSPTYPAPI